MSATRRLSVVLLTMTIQIQNGTACRTPQIGFVTMETRSVLREHTLQRIEFYFDEASRRYGHCQCGVVKKEH